MTEISLIVTLNNQFNSTQLKFYGWMCRPFLMPLVEYNGTPVSQRWDHVPRKNQHLLSGYTVYMIYFLVPDIIPGVRSHIPCQMNKMFWTYNGRFWENKLVFPIYTCYQTAPNLGHLGIVNSLAGYVEKHQVRCQLLLFWIATPDLHVQHRGIKS